MNCRYHIRVIRAIRCEESCCFSNFDVALQVGTHFRTKPRRSWTKLSAHTVRGRTIMHTWPTHPVIYEINTWVWLGELSRKYQRPVNLAGVPPEEWDTIAAYRFDAVWLMGVWERSPEGIAISMRNEGLLE